MVQFLTSQSDMSDKQETTTETNTQNTIVLVQLCLTLSDPMDCSMPGFPVLHHLPEFAQTHVHQVGDTIQPSHLLSLTSPPVFNLSQHQERTVFSNESVLCIRWPKYWSFSFSISLFLYLSERMV